MYLIVGKYISESVVYYLYDINCLCIYIYHIMYNIHIINNQNQYCSERDLIDYLVQTLIFINH